MTRCIRPICLVLSGAVSVVAVTSRAGAQRIVSTIDVGGASVRYADTLSSAAYMLSPGIQLDFDHATFGAAGSYSQIGSGSWMTQGLIGGSLYTPAAGPLLLELEGTAGGTANQDGTSTGRSLGYMRAHFMAAQRGLWLGAGAGAAWDGITWSSMREGEAGVWSHVGGNATALATFTPTMVGDTIRYSDTELAVRWESPRVELGASAGMRSGNQGRSMLGGSGRWESVTVATWVTSHAAIVGSAGTYPMDLSEGFPGGRFVSVALRLGHRSLRHYGDRVAHDAAGPMREDDAEPVRAFKVSAPSVGGRTIGVLAPGASVVEINGDFTDWLPVTLTKVADGWWSVTLPLAHGTHELNVRLDGGAWLVPPPLATLHDEFGGATGLLVVP